MRLTWGLCSSILALALSFASFGHAQTCDYMLINGWWSNHSDPDSIVVHFVADVQGPVSSDPGNPSEYGMDVSVRFDGAPIADDHPLVLRWWHAVGCPQNCPNVVCEEKEWSYKGTVFRDQSRCLLNAQQVCGCPRLGNPVAHRKVARRPPHPGTIEIEIVPLDLVSCPAVNPTNDRIEIPFPGGGGTPVPGAGTWTLAVLAALLAAVAMLVPGRRARRV